MYAVVSVAATGTVIPYRPVPWRISPVAVAVAVKVQYSQEPAQPLMAPRKARSWCPDSFRLPASLPLPQRQVFHPVYTILGLVHVSDQFQVADALPKCDLELMPVDDASKHHALPLAFCGFA